jgi:hypothetical protein
MNTVQIKNLKKKVILFIICTIPVLLKSQEISFAKYKNEIKLQISAGKDSVYCARFSCFANKIEYKNRRRGAFIKYIVLDSQYIRIQNDTLTISLASDTASCKFQDSCYSTKKKYGLTETTVLYCKLGLEPYSSVAFRFKMPVSISSVKIIRIQVPVKVNNKFTILSDCIKI